jgi:hypothetical protein
VAGVGCNSPLLLPLRSVRGPCVSVGSPSRKHGYDSVGSSARLHHLDTRTLAMTGALGMAIAAARQVFRAPVCGDRQAHVGLVTRSVSTE